MALSCYNLLAVIKGTLRAVHGQETIEKTLSNFYMTDEISNVYRGMMIALPPEEWQPLTKLTDAAFAQWLREIAGRVNLKRYPKKPRGPKKARPRRTRFTKAKHIATARLLAEERGRM